MIIYCRCIDRSGRRDICI